MTEEEKLKEAMERYRKHCEHLLDTIPLPVVSEAGKREEYMLPSKDGCKLETWLFFPENMTEPVSLIAVRSCYPNQEGLLLKKAEAFTKRGFGFAIQWCRGTHDSEGEWVPNIHERDDGLSFMNFLQEDERIRNIGYWGDSYLAMTGWCMADAVPAKVKAMCLGVYGCFRHVSAYKDGLFRQDILTAWAMDNAGKPVTTDYMKSAAYRPQIHVDEDLWGIRLDWYRDWITHTDADDPYWKEGFWGELQQIPAKIKIPLYVRDGWYDHHLGSALCTWNSLSEETKSKSVLEIGPWNHYSAVCLTHQNTESLQDNSFSGPALWFDKILRKGEDPKEDVRLYEIGADKTEHYSEFPIEEQGKCVLYLQAGSTPEGHTLIKEKSAEDSATSYDYDPEHPVLSHGCESTFRSTKENGSLIQPPVGERSDVVSFLSEKLDTSLHINGKICVTLYVSSDAKDTAFTGKLMEVFEDGTAVNIRGTATTLAYRNDAPHRGMYTPNEVVPITLCMWDIDWLAKKGSQLRLDVSSSDFPEYSIHSNQEGIWSLQTKSIIAKQTIYTGGTTQSRIEIPIMES